MADRTSVLVNQVTIAGAETVIGGTIGLDHGTTALAALAKLVVAGGGTTVDVYIQTSLDRGVTWIDIMNLTFTTATASKVSAVNTAVALAAAGTPGDGALADNSILNGLLGDRIRAKFVVAGTYTGVSHLTVTTVSN